MVTMTSRPARGFQRGRSTYVCATCGRTTRETTVSGSDDCEDCFDLAGLQNAVWDGCFDAGDAIVRDNILTVIGQKGGDTAKVRAAFADLFAEGR